MCAGCCVARLFQHQPSSAKGQKELNEVLGTHFGHSNDYFSIPQKQ
jgi:hypothetical protein